MIRAVVDTNVLASGSLKLSHSPGLILLAWADLKFELIASEHILNELETTLSKPYFREALGSRPAANLISAIRRKGVVLEHIRPLVVGVATHPEDDLVLSTAVSGNAGYLITGDRQLLKLGEYQGVQIVSAAEFLLILQSH